jgi:cytidine deaminase
MSHNIPSRLRDEYKKAVADAEFLGSFLLNNGNSQSDIESLLELAREFARPPISGFRVGALAIGTSGKCYLGANMEFVGVPLHASLHAEQSAVLNAWTHGEEAIEALIVSESPCGHCRQFLFELHDATELTITVRGASQKLGELMPEPFAEPRKKGHSLLDSSPQCLDCSQSNLSENARHAIEAARCSYSPYSHSPEGFVIETESGQRFVGRNAESIAFNPSVPAVVTALNQMNLSAHRETPISQCAHANLASALPHSLAFSEQLIRGICNAPVESVSAIQAVATRR